MNILIPMAGLGTRFSNEGYDLPKPLISVNNKTLIQHSVESLGIYGNLIFITRDFGKKYNDLLSHHLNQIAPGSIEIKIDKATRGATETCLVAKEFINSDQELIITNCDQILEWDPASFLTLSRQNEVDGSVLLYKSDSPKNSFAKLSKDSLVVEVAEKKVISDFALVGLHYWKKGADFIDSAEFLLKDFLSEGKPECYISETYNYMLNEKKAILGIEIEPKQYISLGTPYDVSIYVGKKNEFKIPKSKTIFCDIDGTIINHAHKFSDLVDNQQTSLVGVIKKFNEWDSIGHKIILCTARKESAREMTEKHLKDLGFCWDQLIMGLTSGTRVLINDKLSEKDADRSISVNVITDEGFLDVDWDVCGL